MTVVYISMIGFLCALAIWQSWRMTELKSELSKTIEENKALDEGMDELGQMNSDQELTLTELFDTLTERNEQLNKLQQDNGKMALQIVEHEEEIERLEKNILDRNMSILAFNEQINEYKLMLDSAQSRARDLEQTTTFHVNNCLPSLIDPSRT